MGLAALPNLGPASEKMLAQAGITTLEQLQSMGPVTAYLRTIQVTGKPNLNLLWALAGALSDTHWTQISGELRSNLLLELDALQDIQKHPLFDGHEDT